MSASCVVEHVQHFADTMLGLKPHELEPEHYEFATKQLLAAEITSCSWAQVCAHVTPGAVESLRFSSMGQIDAFAATHEIDPAFYVQLAQQASFPDEHQARTQSPTLSDFWQTVCPTFSVGHAIMAFHATNLPNARAVVLALAKDAGRPLLEQRLIGSALDQYQNGFTEHAELATELGQLWSSVGFPADLFAAAASQQQPVASATDEAIVSSIEEEVGKDEYSKRILQGQAMAAPDAHSQLRQHPMVETYRKAALLPATFPLAKTLVQLLAPAQCEAALGPRQTCDSVGKAVANTPTEGKEELLLQTLRVAKNLPLLLDTPQARQLYSTLRNKHGTEWIAQNLDGPRLATRLITSASQQQLQELPLALVLMSV